MRAFPSIKVCAKIIRWLCPTTTRFRLDLRPGWNGFDSIEQAGGFEHASQGWTLANFKLNEQAAILNRKAAWWTIVAAVLGALATIVGLLPLPW